MIKTIPLLLLYIICYTNSIGQSTANIQHQKNYQYADGFILDSLHITEPDFTSINLQIRISIWHFASGIHKKIILDRYKNGNWLGHSYEYYYYNPTSYDFSLTTTNQLPIDMKWDSAFEAITSKGYINLPSQNKVERKIAASNKGTGNKLAITIADGTSYTYEFLTNKRKRKFSFSNPEARYLFHHQQQHNDTAYYASCMDLLHITDNAIDSKTYLQVQRK